MMENENKNKRRGRKQRDQKTNQINQNISSEDELSIMLNKLYHSLHPTISNDINLQNNYINLLKRILSSDFSVMKNDETSLVNLLLEKVSKLSNFNEENLNKFQYLYSKLLKKKSLSKRWNILYILNSLSKTEPEFFFPASDDLQNKLLNYNSYISGNNLMDNEFYLLNNINPHQKITITKNDYIENNKQKENYLKNLNPVSNVNEIFCKNQEELNLAKKNIINSPIVTDQNKTSMKITEQDLINDLLFVFEGIDGKYIAYDLSIDSFALNNKYPWNENIYDIVNSLSELGWLFKKIKSYIDYFKELNIKSQFIQSFIYSVENELNNYFKLISYFKKLNTDKNKNNKNLLNLKNLVLWTNEPKQNLKWICDCCESIRSLKGANVLSQIYSFVNFGGCKNFLNNILNDVSKPFLNYIINWIKYGEFEDPYKEFFVNILENVKDEDIWNLKYQLIAKNIPNFMKREPTIKILETGKCIHFIRHYCQEKNYSLYNLKRTLLYIKNKYILHNNELNNEDKNLEENFDYGIDEDKIIFEKDSYDSCLKFIDLLFNNEKNNKKFDISFISEILYNIDLIHTLINKELIKIIFVKFKFSQNLDCINKYLLLGQGDMMQTLMDIIYDELKKPASLIYKHILQANLESAIKSTNAQFNDEECTKKLFIKLINPGNGDIGWDIFCLDYKVDLPLSIIFNDKLLTDYQKLFIFFWKMKRIEYELNQIWKKFMGYSHLMKNNFYKIKKSIQKAIFFNQQIMHFITNLHNYFALEVLETQYKNLSTNISKIKNLGELINLHKNFANNIKKQCLLDDDGLIISQKLVSIFNIIFRFKTSFEVLTTSLLEQQYGYMNQSDNNNDYVSKVNNAKFIIESQKQIDSLFKDYKNKIIELINLINQVGKQNLKYLTTKIDFNYYYSLLEAEKEAQIEQETLAKINKEQQRRMMEYKYGIYDDKIDNIEDYKNDDDDYTYNMEGNNYGNNDDGNNYGNNNENNYNNNNDYYKNNNNVDDVNNYISDNNQSNYNRYNLQSSNDNSNYSKYNKYGNVRNNNNTYEINNSKNKNENNEYNINTNVNNINEKFDDDDEIQFNNSPNIMEKYQKKTNNSNNNTYTLSYSKQNIPINVSNQNYMLNISNKDTKSRYQKNNYVNKNISSKNPQLTYEHYDPSKSNNNIINEDDDEDQIITTSKPKIFTTTTKSRKNTQGKK